MGVDVGVRIFGLAVLGKHTGHHLVHGVDHVEELILWEVLQRKVPLARVPRVGLPQHRVAVAGDHLRRSLRGRHVLVAWN